jgi:hypothetical protein
MLRTGPHGKVNEFRQKSDALCGVLALGGVLGWKHFQRETVYSKHPEDQEKPEKLYDH